MNVLTWSIVLACWMDWVWPVLIFNWNFPSPAVVTTFKHPHLTSTSDQINTMCRMCGKVPESLADVLAGCSSLAQTKYTDRHNAALKVLFFEVLRDFQARRLCSSLVLAGGAQTNVRVNRRSSILGCACLRRTHFRLSQQGGCAICRPQKGAGCGNELSSVGQSCEEGHWEDRQVRTIAVKVHQTIPRLQDRTAERHHGRTGRMVH